MYHRDQSLYGIEMEVPNRLGVVIVLLFSVILADRYWGMSNCGYDDQIIMKRG